MRNAIIMIFLLFLIGSLSACSDDDCPVRPQPKSSIQLAEITFRTEGGTREIFDSMTLIAYYTENVIELPEIGLADGAQGYTVVFDTSYAGVTEFFEKMTNGIDERLLAKFKMPSGFSQDFDYESVLIAGGTTGDLHPDLNGTSISGAVLHLDKVVIDSPGANPNGDGIWTSWNIEVRLEIIGFLNA